MKRAHSPAPIVFAVADLNWPMAGRFCSTKSAKSPRRLQAKLLRVLQENTFERVGSSSRQQVDVRVIATTNRDLEAALKEGKFRQDLFYRLNVVPIELPPLRQRARRYPRTVPAFPAWHRQAREQARFGISSPEAMRVLQRYNWPGNVRELQNIIERAGVLETEPGVIRAATDRAVAEDRPSRQREHRGAGGQAAGGHREAGDPQHAATVQRPSNQNRAARLGSACATLGMKLKRWREEGELIEASA